MEELARSCAVARCAVRSRAGLPRSRNSTVSADRSEIGAADAQHGGGPRAIAQGSAAAARAIVVEYVVAVTTGGGDGSGTGSRVWVQLFGDERPQGTGEIELRDDDRIDLASTARLPIFTPGRTDRFRFEAAPVGNLTDVRLWHDRSSDRPSWCGPRAASQRWRSAPPPARGS